jgi:alanine racemase
MMTDCGGKPSTWRGRPAWAEIDLDALRANALTLKRRAARAELAAVVKANAYGHGAIACAQALLAAGADRFAVACVEEGRELREAGVQAPILVLGTTPVSLAKEVVTYRLTPTVNTRQLALALAAFAERRGVRQPIHLKVDTGLNRFGLPPQDAVSLAQSLRRIPSLFIEGIFTHFATGDEADKRFTYEQYALFTQVVQQLDWIPLRHVANTATLLDSPDLSLDLVRPGIGLYGCYPSAEVGHTTPLRPVLSLKARIARLRAITPGETVGYGRTWTATRPATIALIPLGYADGLPRLLSNQGSILVHGRRAPLVGRVSMDMCVADVSDIPGVQVDDEVVVIGEQDGATITADEIAALAGTISYEILCGIAPRVPRLYLEGGTVVAVQSLLRRPAAPIPTASP